MVYIVLSLDSLATNLLFRSLPVLRCFIYFFLNVLLLYIMWNNSGSGSQLSGRQGWRSIELGELQEEGVCRAELDAKDLHLVKPKILLSMSGKGTEQG